MSAIYFPNILHIFGVKYVTCYINFFYNVVSVFTIPISFFAMIGADYFNSQRNDFNSSKKKISIQ